MTSNIQASSSQMNRISQHSSGLHQSHNSQLVPNPQSNISPVNRVSILTTAEQKEIVRTNVFEPNNTTPINDPKFTVVTEVIKRNSNISFESKPNNVPSNVDNRFSFDKSTTNPTFENRTINVNVILTKENKEESYKLLIKRIAKQLKNKIRQPTHGFFYFAFQKGSYPLMVIKKLEANILNHSIELNSDIFQVYTQKYFRYKELVKKIALLLKRHLSNKMFWENERYKKESIQVKVTNKNVIAKNANIKNNSLGHNTNNVNVANKKNINNNIKANLQNKKTANNNIKNPQAIQLNNQKKNKPHITNSNNINNTKNNLSHPNTSQNNFGNHRFNNTFINPFNPAKNQVHNPKEKKGNLTKKSEKSNLFNKSLKNKNANNNAKNGSSRSASSETNKTGNIKFMNMAKIPEMPNKDNTNALNKEEIKNNSEKTQVITLSKKTVNNNMFNMQRISDSNNDIEIKDESNVINEQTNINNNTTEPNEQKSQLNMKMIPHRNTTSITTNTNLNNSSSLNAQIPNNNSSITLQNNVKKITFDSIKSPGKKLHIKLSPFKKFKEIVKENIKQNESKSKKQIPKPEIKIDINEINIPLNNDKMTDEHISFVNKFKVLMSNNDISIEYNIPMSKSEEGVNHLKKYEFWEKYIYYLYINYLIDKKNKLSLFTFIHLIEQYFLWCEYCEAESAKKFKKLIIDIINKVFSEKDIKQFLEMNKINDLEELFAKYEVFMKYGNKISYRTKKEVEIKIDNDEECNCELCKNEKACVKKISEMNNKSNINMSIESIQIKAEYSPKAKKNTNPNDQLETNNYSISFAGKNKSGLFSKSKTMHSFETVLQYIPAKINNELMDIEEKVEKETYPKRKSKSKSKSKSKRNSKKNEKEEEYIDLTKETKLEEFFEKEKEKEEENQDEIKEEEKEEEISSNNKSRSRKKNSKRNNKKNKKKNSSFIKDETESESEEKDKKKDKKKKKQKSKSRNKSYSRKYPISDSETESDESDFTKNKNKKTSNNPKRKKGKSKW